ncbi:MAG: aminotransferase class I/II-fold pyridoxal phosphate-dependent enzyme [Alphaproteobacteria bacterium]|nr:aminotransferase class I/II-fold pyridoxal phosphate-dependent enzyme [Alphaproteobacteria bacterium]
MIPYGKHYVDEDDIAAVANTLRYGNLTQGPKIPEFEEQVAAYVGAKYAVVVSSATAGLHLSYIALGVQAGDAVLTSPITFVSTANAAHYCGGRAVFADIDRSTLNLDPGEVTKTLADHPDIKIEAPDLFPGSTAGIAEISAVARSAEKYVVEDAAHALGATYPSGAKVPSCGHSDSTGFSLHPVKSIAAGEGGIITTNDDAIYKSLLRLRSHGINKLDDEYINTHLAFTGDETNPWYYEMASIGYHYRNTDIQISLAQSQLKKLEQFLEHRRNIIRRYEAELAPLEHIAAAQATNHQQSANHLYPVAIDFEGLGTTRLTFMNNLKKAGILTQVHYIPVHLHPFYAAQGWQADMFPQSMGYYNTALSLPLYYGLTDDDFDFVISCLKRTLKPSGLSN